MFCYKLNALLFFALPTGYREGKEVIQCVTECYLGRMGVQNNDKLPYVINIMASKKLACKIMGKLESQQNDCTIYTIFM